MVQRRLRAGTGVEPRLSVGREPLQNLRKAAGDRLVTSHRLKPRPAVLTPCTPAENVVGKQKKKKKKSCVDTRVRYEDAECKNIQKRGHVICPSVPKTE